jgi:hypothetical protein
MTKARSNGYLDRAALLTACTTLAEREKDIPGLGRVKLRELTAQQRLDASQAARGGAGDFDAPLFNALVMQMGTLDSAGKPLLMPADVPMLVNGRAVFVSDVANDILTLSEATLPYLKSGDRADDDGQPDAGVSA